MADMINPIDLVSAARLSADVSVTSNGDGAKTAKLKIVANSGGVCYPMDADGVRRPTVFDFSGMKVGAKVPLDWEHEELIGYCNNFDTAGGELNCGGVVSLVDLPQVGVVAKMQQLADGAPFEASVQGLPDLIEYVPEGVIANVNGKDLIGPYFICRVWTLQAVALCKLGADSETSVALAASDKKSALKKGYFIQSSNSKGRKLMNVENTDKQVEAKDTVEAPAEVEVKHDTEKTVAEKPETVEAVAEVEAKSDDEQAEVVEPVKETPEVAEPVKATAVEATDPRAEFKLFQSKFGDKAAEYYASGYSLVDAQDKHMAFLSASLADANKRLGAIGRGGPAPIKFGDGANREATKASAKPSMIRLHDKEYK